jgi:hypothetical protein
MRNEGASDIQLVKQARSFLSADSSSGMSAYPIALAPAQFQKLKKRSNNPHARPFQSPDCAGASIGLWGEH